MVGSTRPGTSPERPADRPGPLAVGDLLAERYRLLELVAQEGPAALWRAYDDVLARPVAVKCVPTPNKAARDEAQTFLAAAVRTGAVNHPGLARIYDAALESRPGRGHDVAYVIGEWVEGEALDAHLERVGALAAVDAADVLRQAVDAAGAVHAAGLTHGRLHPRNVLVTTHGRVRLTDAHVAAALRGTPAGTVADDTRDLAAVLYALVTRRWPSGATPQPAGALPPAPREGDHVLTARQVRAGVPRELDQVLIRALEPSRPASLPALRTPAALGDAVDASVADARAEETAEESVEPRDPGRLRRRLPWLVAVAFVAAVGVLGWTLGLAVGEVPGRPGTQPIVSASEAAAPGLPTYPAIPLTGAVIRDFDPLGRDHQENPDQVRNAYDDEPSTAWVTQSYQTADFSGLKPGVGLLIDLRRTHALHTVSVAFTAQGAHVEVRVSDTAPTTLAQLRPVAGDAKGDQVATMRPPAGTAARYVLIWITQLPKDGKTFRVGVSEIRLT
ncbi:MAG: hypothetical protein JWL79_3792 [Frankiales bacterium]|nr:hypothetical protein [Frankiales bacterium]